MKNRSLNSIDEPYQDPGLGMKLRDTKKRPKSGRPFRPSGNGTKIVNSEFEHFQEYNPKVYTKREGPNQVRLGNPNFVTAPYKKGGGRNCPGNTL